MAQALSDISWQQSTRVRLQASAQRLRRVLDSAGLAPVGGSPLFHTVRMDTPTLFADSLARQGVLVRVFEKPGMVRFGLAPDEAQWCRLEKALAGALRD
jgi:cobalamin biosynthetic protein CobC